MSAILNTYNRKKIAFNKGKGSFLYGTNGKKYLDFVQGIAVNCLGHANNYLINSISRQSKKLWHVSNAFIIPEQERLAKRLKQKTFADYVFFQILVLKQPRLLLNLLEDIFIQRGSQEKIEFYVLIIVFMEELLQLFLRVIAKKPLKVLDLKLMDLIILILAIIKV